MKTIVIASKSAGARDIEFAKNAPEVFIFMTCFALVNALVALKKEGSEQRLANRKFNAIFLQFQAVVEATARFDVLMPVSSACKISPFFWRWYNWWDDYLKTLAPETLCFLETLARKRVPTGSKFRPKGDWLTYRSDAPFTVEVT